MNDSNKTEELSLIEVSDDSETLELIDGSRWEVEPTDIVTVCTWIPLDTIRVRLIEPASLWPYRLTNVGMDATVRARKLI